jgi:glyoxylase-like metal-dependent hydrolase (beta-lactamase superfamily II)
LLIPVAERSIVVQEILPGWYHIKLPLPRNPLKELNSYILRGDDRWLIIDTGMNREECYKAMMEGLNELKVDLAKTDYFITHLHADHYGQVGVLSTPTSRVYMPKPDADILSLEPTIWRDYAAFAVLNGFPPDEVDKAIANHPGVKYSFKKPVQLTSFNDGETLNVGRYSFKIIWTPGHTPGHECLYEAKEKILIAGDHILGDITPNISEYSETLNPLQDYLDSLDKVYNLDVKLVLPGHRSFFTTFRERIDELKQHHKVRAEEVLTILKKETRLDGYKIAARMTWDMIGPWEQFPVSQKWFATGEALAHIKYLEDLGRIKKDTAGPTWLYSVSS